MTTCMRMRPSRSPIERLAAGVRPPAKGCRGLIVVLVLLSFGTGTGLALDCIGPERLLFPPSGDIPPNPVFILQLPVGDLAEVLSADRFDLHFVGGHTRVRILERSDAGPGYMTFAPVEPLPAGIVGLRFLETHGGRSVEWTHLGTYKVQGPSDATVPALLQQAARVTARVQDDPGLGSSISVDLPVTADESPVLWLATINVSEQGIPQGRPVTMFLPVGGPTLYAGACGGNYPLEHGKQYRVDLTPIDAAGHRGGGTAPSILVDIP